MTDPTPDSASAGGLAAGQSFAEFFAGEIAPGLQRLEDQRRDRMRATYTRFAGVAFVVVLAAIIAWLLEQPVVAVAVLVLGGLFGGLWGLQPARRHREAVRALFVPPLCRFLGNLEHHRKPDDRFDLSRVERSGIVGAFDRSKLEDLFIGRHRGTEFRMAEARLRKRGIGRRKRQRTVFAGLLCEVSVPVPFSGVVLLVGDKGELGNRIVGRLRGSFAGLEAVTLDHAAFEARYQIYRDNPAEAERLLQPALMETLLALADELDLKAVNCAFLEERFLLALPQRRDLFEIGRLHRSLERAEEDLLRLAAEFTIPHRLIDNLHGDRKPLIPDA